MRKIFIPTQLGDIQLEQAGKGKQTRVIFEELTAAENELLDRFLEICGTDRGRAKRKRIVNVPLEEAHDKLMEVLKPGKPLLKAIKVAGGKVELVNSFSEKEFEVAVSVEKAPPRCPIPIWEQKEVRGQRVLKEFLSEQQWNEFEKARMFLVIGNFTHHRYILISRWNPMSQVHGVVYCLTTEKRSCTGLEHVPPSEELLAMKIFIECAEEEFIRGRI